MTTLQGIKGFNNDLTCHGFQFAPGETYTTDKAVSCKSGFHACPDDLHPFSVFGFYPPGQSRYFAVTQSGDICRRERDKAASTILTVNGEIGIGELVARAVDWVIARCTPTGAASNSGYQGAASNSGYQGAASNSGDYGAASNSGYQGAASNSGDYGAASNSGYYGVASNSGYQGAASNSGDYGVASNSGYQGVASNSGDYGVASNSGYYGAAISHASGGRVLCEDDGQALFCTEFAVDGSIKSVASGITGQKGIKAGVWYTCHNGTLVIA
jgi:hypothetical protein